MGTEGGRRKAEGERDPQGTKLRPEDISPAMVAPEIEVDARGLYCPLPVLRLAKALRDQPSGTVARLLATDPAAVEDVEVFCREGGHRLFETRREESVYFFVVQKQR
jgi:tRNA 2-thiouridine synthesizing protein A